MTTQRFIDIIEDISTRLKQRYSSEHDGWGEMSQIECARYGIDALCDATCARLLRLDDELNESDTKLEQKLQQIESRLDAIERRHQPYR